MKRIVLIALISFFAQKGSADSFSCAWDGIGIASRNNYDMAYSYGAYYYIGIARGLGLGAQEIYQKYNMYYDDERYRRAGASVRMNCTYYIFSPMFVFQLTESGQHQCYFTGGIGQLKGGTVTLRKWSDIPSTGVKYDSTIDQADNLSKMIYRLGIGFSHFYYLGGNFHLFINEDMGFVTSNISDVANPSYGQVKGNMSQFFKPTYFTLRIGISYISHSKDRDNKWRLYAGSEM